MKYYVYEPDLDNFAGIRFRVPRGQESFQDPLKGYRRPDSKWTTDVHFTDKPLSRKWETPVSRFCEGDPDLEGDFPNLFGCSQVPVMSERAWNGLLPLIGYCCEPLPIIYPTAKTYFVIHVLETIDCLDRSASTIERRYSDPDDDTMLVKHYVFKPRTLRDKHILKLPNAYGGDLLVDDTFRKAVEANGLKGLIFGEVNERKKPRQLRPEPPLPVRRPRPGSRKTSRIGTRPGDDETYFDNQTWAAIMTDAHTELYEPATEEMIAAFEEESQFQLPAAHCEFLKRANGGAVGIARIFGVEREDYLDLSYKVTNAPPEMKATADGPIFPFASDWGGSYFCYDLREKATPRGYPVLYWDHEYAEMPRRSPKLWTTYAPHFVAFVKKVFEEEKMYH